MPSFDFSDLSCFLSKNGIFWVHRTSLKYRTYLKSGGDAECLVFPSSVEQLECLLKHLHKNDVDFALMGGASNLMFVDELNYGVVISTLHLDDFTVVDDRFRVGAGYVLSDFVRSALIHRFGGLEGLEGVPGTVGGAIVMNAGAYGYSISDHLINVQCLDRRGRRVDLDASQCELRYRHSLFKLQRDLIVVGALFQLPQVDQHASARRIEAFHIARHSYQEFAFPTLGSAFSVKGDFYHELFCRHKGYSALGFLAKLIFKNPVSKFLFRKNPTNRPLNWVARRYIGSLLDGVDVSHKSMNILINSGGGGFRAKAQYFNALRRSLPAQHRIENEIVFHALRSSADRARAAELMGCLEPGIVTESRGGA